MFSLFLSPSLSGIFQSSLAFLQLSFEFYITKTLHPQHVELLASFSAAQQSRHEQQLPESAHIISLIMWNKAETEIAHTYTQTRRKNVRKGERESERCIAEQLGCQLEYSMCVRACACLGSAHVSGLTGFKQAYVCLRQPISPSLPPLHPLSWLTDTTYYGNVGKCCG